MLKELVKLQVDKSELLSQMLVIRQLLPQIRYKPATQQEQSIQSAWLLEMLSVVQLVNRLLQELRL